jgi:diguanylate cyclase (GGDEF)-like protein
MTIKLAAALIYWVIVALWLAVLGTVIVNYVRNPRLFGTTRMLLAVVGIDTCRNIVENVYFGLFFGGQYGLFPSAIAHILGTPELLIVPKLMNIAAGGLVLGLLLMRWLPKAEGERDRSEKVKADLETLATMDGLTSLLNRRQFEIIGLAEWTRFQRYGRPLSLLLLDVDNFKLVNDRFGHDAGDVVLREVAKSCKTAARDTDIVARIGGEEFALLLPETDETAAAIFAERLRERIEREAYSWGGDKPRVSVSIGVAGGTLSMSGFEILLKRADEALYRAKDAGRNRVVRAPREPIEAYQIAAV